MGLGFDEVNDYVSMAAAPALPDADWAIGGWVKLTDNEGLVYQHLCSWSIAGTTPSLVWRFGEASNGTASYRNKLMFRIFDNDGTYSGVVLSTSTPGTSTAWQFLLLQRSGNTVTQYINGAADGSFTDANFDAISVATPWIFGGTSDLAAGYFFGGNLAEWFVVPYALSAGQIAGLAAGMSPEQLYRGSGWRMPMRHSAREVWAGLSVTDNSGGIAAHPIVEDDPFSPGMVSTIQPAIAA